MIEGKKYIQESGSALAGGTLLRGRYRLEKPLGQGGFGITYSAMDMKTYHRVAVKELFPSRYVERRGNLQTVQAYAGQEETFAYMRNRFEQEAKTLIRLQGQEGVVRLMHMFGENNTVYYVMELLEGEDLNKRLKRAGTMSWNQLTPIMKTVLNALEQIHSAGMIHRDISPDNIFLTDSGARLIDFGSVRAYQGDTHFTALVKQNFAPWEQFLSNGHQGPWTDIYALCVTAYYALSGQLPPRAPERRINEEIKPLELLCKDLPKEICAAIHQGMAVESENRFQCVSELRRALLLDDAVPVVECCSGSVMCMRGGFAGRKWRLEPDSVLRIGRNRECDVVYPADYRGVSREQCTIHRTTDNKYRVRDENSRFGTRLWVDGKLLTLEPRKWYTVDSACVVFGGQEKFALK